MRRAFHRCVLRSSPVVHGTVEETVHRQVCRLVREGVRHDLVVVDTEAGVSPGMSIPSSKLKVLRKTSFVAALCFMYSWMPKLGMAMPRWMAAASPTGETSVGPCTPDLIW